MNLKRKKAGKKKYIVLLILISIIIVFLATLNINEITIKGNNYYSDEQIKEITKINNSKNTIAYLIKNKINPIGEIPFLDKVEIKLESLNSLHIDVYEKKVIGCAQYMSTYLYFDKEGVVVETSSVKREEILEIQGLEFDRVVLLKQLPVDNPKIFEGILELIQLISKYNLEIDVIHFDKMYNITLVSADIKIKCGQASDLQSKISKLEKVLPEIEGKKGEIDLKNANKNILFKEEIQEETMGEEDKEEIVEEEIFEEGIVEEEITEEE